MTTDTQAAARLDIAAAASDAYEAMTNLDQSVSLGEPLRSLIRLRASLVNGCIYCIGLYDRALRQTGEGD